MKAFQKRVVAEKIALDEKIDRLVSFIETKKFSDLDSQNRLLLVRQRDAMRAYSVVLGQRISLFE